MNATPQDLAAIDRLINPGPPERIYGWQHNQMSIARHYGGLDYQGHQYMIAYHEEGQPLVRSDVIRREAKEAGEKAKAERKAAKLAKEAAQGDLI